MKKNNGYTLIELFAAIAIVAVAIYAFATIIVVAGILTLSSITYLSHYKKNKLIQTAERIAADINYAQNRAMAEGSWHGIHFEPNPINTYYVYQTSGLVSAPETDPGKPGNDLTVNVKEKFGVIIDCVELEGGFMSVEFDEYGRPYSSFNGKAITSEGSIVLRLGNLIKTIIISPDTGRISIQ